MESNHELVAESAGPTRPLREAVPETWAAFGEHHRSAVSDGIVPRATKFAEFADAGGEG